MHPVLAAFPNRPLAVRVPARTWPARVFAVFGALLFGACGIWFGISYLPGVVTDFSLRGVAQPVPTARVSNGHCTTRKGILTDCDVTLSRSIKGRGEVSRNVSYFFVDFHTGNYTVAVMADPARPDLLTTDMGLDYYWDRAITLAVFLAIMFGLAVASLVALFAPNKARVLERALSGRPLTPTLAIPVTIQKNLWTVRDEHNQRTAWPVPGKAIPFGVPGPRILAVTAPGVGGMVPLDEDLSWLDLTDEERRRLHAAANVAPGPLPAGAPRAAPA